MNSPRERQLAEGLKNYLIGIQKSKQIYEHLAKLKKITLEMSEKKIDSIAKNTAARVEKFVVKRDNSGKSASTNEVKAKIKEELEKIAQ